MSRRSTRRSAATPAKSELEQQLEPEKDNVVMMVIPPNIAEQLAKSGGQLTPELLTAIAQSQESLKPVPFEIDSQPSDQDEGLGSTTSIKVTNSEPVVDDGSSSDVGSSKPKRGRGRPRNWMKDMTSPILITSSDQSPTKRATRSTKCEERTDDGESTHDDLEMHETSPKKESAKANKNVTAVRSTRSNKCSKLIEYTTPGRRGRKKAKLSPPATKNNTEQDDNECEDDAKSSVTRSNKKFQKVTPASTRGRKSVRGRGTNRSKEVKTVSNDNHSTDESPERPNVGRYRRNLTGVKKRGRVKTNVSQTPNRTRRTNVNVLPDDTEFADETVKKRSITSASCARGRGRKRGRYARIAKVNDDDDKTNDTEMNRTTSEDRLSKENADINDQTDAVIETAFSQNPSTANITNEAANHVGVKSTKAVSDSPEVAKINSENIFNVSSVSDQQGEHAKMPAPAVSEEDKPTKSSLLDHPDQLQISTTSNSADDDTLCMSQEDLQQLDAVLASDQAKAILDNLPMEEFLGADAPMVHSGEDQDHILDIGIKTFITLPESKDLLEVFDPAEDSVDTLESAENVDSSMNVVGNEGSNVVLMDHPYFMDQKQVSDSTQSEDDTKGKRRKRSPMRRSQRQQDKVVKEQAEKIRAENTQILKREMIEMALQKEAHLKAEESDLSSSGSGETTKQLKIRHSSAESPHKKHSDSLQEDSKIVQKRNRHNSDCRESDVKRKTHQHERRESLDSQKSVGDKHKDNIKEPRHSVGKSKKVLERRESQQKEGVAKFGNSQTSIDGSDTKKGAISADWKESGNKVIVIQKKDKKAPKKDKTDISYLSVEPALFSKPDVMICKNKHDDNATKIESNVISDSSANVEVKEKVTSDSNDGTAVKSENKFVEECKSDVSSVVQNDEAKDLESVKNILCHVEGKLKAEEIVVKLDVKVELDDSNKTVKDDHGAETLNDIIAELSSANEDENSKLNAMKIVQTSQSEDSADSSKCIDSNQKRLPKRERRLPARFKMFDQQLLPLKPESNDEEEIIEDVADVNQTESKDVKSFRKKHSPKKISSAKDVEGGAVHEPGLLDGDKSEVDGEASDDSWCSEDDPERLWCICQMPHNNRFMICCDTCEDWFHGSCVGVSKKDGKILATQGKSWFCPICVKDNVLKNSGSKAAPVVNKEESPTAPSNGDNKPSSSVNEDQMSSSTDDKSKLLAQIVDGDKKSTVNEDSSVADKKNAHIKLNSDEMKKILEKVVSKQTKVENESKCSPTSSKVVGSVKLSPGTIDKVKANKTKIKPPNTCIAPGCMKGVRKVTMYCSDDCVRKYAISSLRMIRLAREKLFHKHGIKKPSAIRTINEPVVVMERRTGKVISGHTAPTESSLQQWLLEHQTYEVIPPGGMNKIRKLREPVKKLKETTVAAPSTTSEPQATTSVAKTPPQKKTISEDSIRSNVRKMLMDALNNRLKDVNDMKMSELEVKEITESIEKEMFRYYRDVGMKYKTKCRSLVFNIKDAKNHGLFRKILKGRIKPYKLVRMTTEEMASKELAEWRERENKHMLEMIKKDEEERMKKILIQQRLEKIQIFDEKTANLEVQVETPKLEDGKKSSKASSSGVKKTVDTTSQHKSHLFDQNCSICTKKSSSSKHSSGVHKKDHKSKERRYSASSSGKHHHHHRQNHKKTDSKSKDKLNSLKSADSKDTQKKVGFKDVHTKSSSNDSTSKSDSSSVKKSDSGDSLLDKSPSDDHLAKKSSKKLEEEGLKSDDVVENVTKSVKMGEGANSTQSKDSVAKPETLKKLKIGNQEVKAVSLPSPLITPPISQNRKSLWKGFLSMPEVTKFVACVTLVFGPNGSLAEAVPDTMQICGRIHPDQVYDYLNEVKNSVSRELVVLQFHPASDEENIAYISFYEYLSIRNRFCVVTNFSKQVKDFYIMPLASHNALPNVLKDLKGPGLPDERPHLLLGILVIKSYKRPSALPKNELPQKQAKMLPKKKDEASAGDTKSYTPPQQSPKQQDEAKISNEQDDSLTPPLENRESDDEPYEPSYTPPLADENNQADSPYSPSHTVLSDDDDNKPYDPEECERDLQKLTNLAKLQQKLEQKDNTSELTSQDVMDIKITLGKDSVPISSLKPSSDMEKQRLLLIELTKRVEEQRVSLEKQMISSGIKYSSAPAKNETTKDASSKSSEQTTAAVLPANTSSINLPPNLAEILRSLKDKGQENSRQQKETVEAVPGNTPKVMTEDPIIKNFAHYSPDDDYGGHDSSKGSTPPVKDIDERDGPRTPPVKDIDERDGSRTPPVKDIDERDGSKTPPPVKKPKVVSYTPPKCPVDPRLKSNKSSDKPVKRKDPRQKVSALKNMSELELVERARKQLEDMGGGNSSPALESPIKRATDTRPPSNFPSTFPPPDVNLVAKPSYMMMPPPPMQSVPTWSPPVAPEAISEMYPADAIDHVTAAVVDFVKRDRSSPSWEPAAPPPPSIPRRKKRRPHQHWRGIKRFWKGNQTGRNFQTDNDSPSYAPPLPPQDMNAPPPPPPPPDTKDVVRGTFGNKTNSDRAKNLPVNSDHHHRHHPNSGQP